MSTVPGRLISDDAIDSQHYTDGSIDGVHLSQNAKDTVLSDKFLAVFTLTTGFTSPSADNVNYGQQLQDDFLSGDLEGSSSKAGVILDPPDSTNNKCLIVDSTTGDTIEDSVGRDVFGRMTTTKITLTGTTSWTNGSTTVTGTVSLFLSEVLVDDLLVAPDGTIVRVASITDNFTLDLVNNYGGVNTSGETTLRHRITLLFFVDVSGVDTAFAMTSQVIDIAFPESFPVKSMPFNTHLSDFKNQRSPGIFVLDSARASNNATDIFLRASDGIPLNVSPYVLPFNASLIAISASTNIAETYDIEVYKNADIVAPPTDGNKIANLAVAAADFGTVILTPVSLNSGDKIGVFIDGINITQPHAMLHFIRR